MDTDKEPAGWNGWGHHVLAELKRNEVDHQRMLIENTSAHDRLFKELSGIKTSITTMKGKQTLISIVVGVLPATFVAILWWISNKSR